MEINDSKEKEKQEKILEEFANQQEGVSSVSQVGPKITQIPGARLPWEKENYSLGNQIGWIPIKVTDLPTQGLFYPKDTAVAIRAASGGEIRHWSTLQDDPNTNPNFLSDMDDMLNYIIERCVTIKSSNDQGLRLSWKDIKEVDRFYLILAIHELTFSSGENKLQVTLSEKKKLDVKKDMISYIVLDPRLMKYYDEDERLFILKTKTGKVIKIDIPSVGVTQWIKNYIIRKRSNQQSFDEDYLNFAPFVIRNWRGLSEDVYDKFVEESYTWDVTTISILVHVKQLFADTINPIVKFIDEGGMEQSVPLNFPGGIKSIFIISDPFGELE
jgi:hypothetical protein